MVTAYDKLRSIRIQQPHKYNDPFPQYCIASYFCTDLIFVQQPRNENEKLSHTKFYDDQNLTLALQHVLTH